MGCRERRNEREVQRTASTAGEATKHAALRRKDTMDIEESQWEQNMPISVARASLPWYPIQISDIRIQISELAFGNDQRQTRYT